MRLIASILSLAFAWAVAGPAPAAAQQPYYPPLNVYVETESLPTDLLQPSATGGPSAAERVGVKQFLYSELSVTDPGAEEPRDIGARIVADLIVTEGIRFDIPGMEGAFSIEVGQGEFHAEMTALGERLADLPSGTAPPDDVVDLPFRVELTPTSLPIDLVLNPEFFKPMKAKPDGTYEPGPDADSDGIPDNPARLRITLAPSHSLVVRHSWDGETDVALDKEGDAFPSLELVDAAVQLGDTGVVLDISEIMLDLSNESSPTGVSDGPDWKGVVLKSVKVAFVNGLDSAAEERPLTAGSTGSSGTDLTLALENFQIGTGGFSGTISGTGLGLDFALFDMDASLDSVSLQFTRNVLTGSAIGATIGDFPFFEGNALAVQLALDMSGNFKIGLAAPGDGSELVKLGVPSVLDFHVESAFFERRVDPELLLVGLNGKAEMLFLTGSGGSHPKVDVNGLTVTSKGDVSLKGGWLTLSEKAGIDFHGFGITLAQVGFGRTDPNASTGTDPPQSWIGFTGGVKLVAGLGAEAEMKRLQFLWPKQGGGGGVDVKLDGIKVAFQQSNVVRFEGLVEWFEVSGGAADDLSAEGFAGKLKLDLLALNMTVQSRIVIGKASQPQDFAYFFLDAELQLPTGIPLGQSGVSIYGFLGLLAYNMEPNLAPFPSPVKWVNAFRKTDNVVLQQSGDPAPTWGIRNDAFGIGAGVILGTTPDNGFALNGKIALTIAVPGPVIMLVGQANVLKERTELSGTSDPLFTAVALFDGREGIFVVNVGVFYDLVKVIQISGEAEAFFDLDNPARWHVYLGQRTPESKRITATALSLFKASAYYMIEPTGFGFGAKATYGGRWKFGPLRVVLEAWLGYDVGLSWRPIHTWGELGMGGAVELSAFGIGLGLSVSADLGMHAPKRFLLFGDFKVKINLPWPLPDPKATVKLKWESHKNARPQALAAVVSDMTLHARKEEWVFEPTLHSHTDSAGTIVWPGPMLAASALSSPGESIPPEGQSVVDAASIPLVPLDTFASLKFEKSMNDRTGDDRWFGNAFTEGAPHSETIDGKEFQYDAVDATLLHAEKDSLSSFDLSSPIDGELWGNWPAIPFTEERPADNTLDLVGKNGFRYYSNTTYLGYAEDGDAWTEWIAGHYGLNYCLDQMDPRDREKLWEAYHYSPPQPAPEGSAPPAPSAPPPAAASGGPTHLVQPLPVHINLRPPPCPIDLDWLDDEDFVLPPYSVFRLRFEGRVHDGDEASPYRRYANSVSFHTEGPPLVLDDYVRLTVPEFPDRPYYRDHHVGLVFNENYMNKLYREEGQFFQLQILDENEEPIPGAIETEWDEAPAFSLSESEQAWFGMLVALGAVAPADLPRDDLVHAPVGAPGAIRPAERHLVRAWLQDERLGGDARLADVGGGPQWRERNGVGYFDRDEGQVVLFEFGFTSSRYNRFPDLFQPFTDGASAWFTLPVFGDANAELSSGNPLNGDFVDGGSAVHNADQDDIGIFLRHLLSPASPDEFTIRTLHDYVRRTPGYADDITALSDSALAEITSVWTEALGLYDKLEQELKLDRTRDPLPEQVEVNVLESAGTRVGLLIELPEAIDLSRTEIAWEDPLPGEDDVLVVPNPENTRLFVFLMGPSQTRELAEGVHRLEFTYHLELGSQNPRYYTDPPVDSETASLELELPDGEFSLEETP